MRAKKDKKRSREIAETACILASDKKGEDIVLLDMKKLSGVADWFLLVTAASSRRLSAIVDAIEQGLAKKRIFPLRIEGRKNPLWTLLDYNDVIIHVFYKEVRDFYGLDRLWSDAPREYFDGKCLKKTYQKRSKRSS